MTSTTLAQKNSTNPSLLVTLVTQLSVGPAFREVAATLLREQLRSYYPDLDIDPNITMVGTPIWEIVEDQVVLRPTEYQGLTDILARQSILAVPALYIEGEHFLTQLPINEPAVHLPVRINDIAHILNVLAPVMIRGYQQTQTQFWSQPHNSSGPRWHQLSNVLQDFWNVSQGHDWSPEDCLMARQLFRTPTLTDRQANDPYATRAYLIDADRVDDDGKISHIDDQLICVLIGKQGQREVILTHSLLQGYGKYSSLEQLGNALPALLAGSTSYKKIQWRLVEPSGNFFDYLACALISIQIVAIGAMDFTDLREDDEAPERLALPPTPAAPGNGPGLEWYRQTLPDWLRHASTSDLNAYSRHLKDLAALNSLHQSMTYLEGIAPIRQYALEQLEQAMAQDHDDAAQLMLQDLAIMVQTPVFWGTFALPGQFDTKVYSLEELALQNLVALPVGLKTLRWKGPQNLPAWLTVEYLESLITRVDIGKTYLELIKTKLLDDPHESASRQQLYSQHLRIQLPLLALQYKIRNEADVDEKGYRYVLAAMQIDATDRQVDGLTIVVRPLAFVPTRRLDGSADTVANMFVIGPQDPTAGPCLLYRPMLDRPLTQYPSPANLLYDIQQSNSLRDSILAWLPNDARDDYSRYVFASRPSPWVAVDFLVDPFKLWTLNGPLKLSLTALSTDVCETLYKANANALIDLADRQSVSNAEARWATFKRAGWMLFNATLPFLSRPVGVAVWIWQIMDQLQQLIDAQIDADPQSTREALTDLLLNLGMAIAMHVATRNAPRRAARARSQKPHPAPAPMNLPAPIIRQLPNTTSEALLPNHTPPLHTSGATHRPLSSLGAVLDSFKVEKPADLGTQISAVGAHQHLYPDGSRYYAPVGTRWFRVQVDENDTVLIVDANQPARTGPPLMSNRQGQWFVDVRLRLRGGGPKVLVRKAQTLAQKRAEELRKQLSDFENDKKTAQNLLQQTRQAMDQAPSTSAEASRQIYRQTLATQRDDYESALQKLKELQVHAPGPDYAPKALNYVKAQTELTNARIRETMTRFTPKLRTVLDQIERQAEEPHTRNIGDARQMLTLSQEMLQHLDYMQTRFNELRKLARDGARLIVTTKGELPTYSTDDLRALQVTLSRNLCMPEGTTLSEGRAWAEVDQIVDAADIAIQCLRDTLVELSESRLDERIDTLNSLTEQFHLLDERLQDFPAEFSEQAIVANLQGLRDILGLFQRRAIGQLGELCEERRLLRSRPTTPPTPPQPQKKFIRTRYNGLLIGERRLSPIGAETGLVDIRSPLTHKVVATFHEKTAGIWVERLKTPPASPAPLELTVAVSDGQTLLNELPAFMARATTYANQPNRTPLGIEYLYHQHAKRLEQVSNAIDKALTDANITSDRSIPANTVNKALNNAVESLYRQSRQQVSAALKKHPPTVPAIEWLKQNDAITIKKTVSRRRLKGPTPDYLDEYTISDRQTNTALWYAHFHYSTTWAPAKAYLSARLKTLEQYRQGAAADSAAGLTHAQKIEFYRSEISQEQARQLFFTLPRTSSSSSHD